MESMKMELDATKKALEDMRLSSNNSNDDRDKVLDVQADPDIAGYHAAVPVR
jgi:hypothetical protein